MIYNCICELGGYNMNKDDISEEQKYFDLGAILNITSGRLFTNYEDVYEVLNYLESRTVSPKELEKIMPIAKAYILLFYPELNGVGDNVIINNLENKKLFILDQKEIIGEKLALRPMSNKIIADKKSLKVKKKVKS